MPRARGKTTFFLNVQIEIACNARVRSTASAATWAASTSCTHRVDAPVGRASQDHPRSTSSSSALSPQESLERHKVNAKTLTHDLETAVS
jgi:hypothetical protein